MDRSQEHEVTGMVAAIFRASYMFGKVNLSTQGKRVEIVEGKNLWDIFHLSSHIPNSVERYRGSGRSCSYNERNLENFATLSALLTTVEGRA